MQTHLMTMQVKGMVPIVQIVDDHVDNMDLVDGRYELRVGKCRGAIYSVIPEVCEET